MLANYIINFLFFSWGVLTTLIIIRLSMKKHDMFLVNKTEYETLKKNQVKIFNKQGDD